MKSVRDTLFSFLSLDVIACLFSVLGCTFFFGMDMDITLIWFGHNFRWMLIFSFDSRWIYRYFRYIQKSIDSGQGSYDVEPV